MFWKMPSLAYALHASSLISSFVTRYYNGSSLLLFYGSNFILFLFVFIHHYNKNYHIFTSSLSLLTYFRFFNSFLVRNHTTRNAFVEKVPVHDRFIWKLSSILFHYHYECLFLNVDVLLLLLSLISEFLLSWRFSSVSATSFIS